MFEHSMSTRIITLIVNTNIHMSSKIYEEVATASIWFPNHLPNRVFRNLDEAMSGENWYLV